MKPLAYAIVLTFLATSAHAAAIPGKPGNDGGTNVVQPAKKGKAIPGRPGNDGGTNIVRPQRPGGKPGDGR